MELSQLPLEKFEPISLKEMDSVKLLNRTDTKYFFNEAIFFEVLSQLSKCYNVLEIDGKRSTDYKTLYYDTEDLQLYLQHQNGKKNRYKVRMREYMDSGLCFLEIKKKTNKGRTDKKRIKKETIEQQLSNPSVDYIKDTANINAGSLKAMLWNKFKRITLVHKTEKERLTLDFNLSFADCAHPVEARLEELVIAELKQEKFNPSSHFVKVIKQYGIRPMRISKYCTGTILLNQNVKQNRFKKRMRMIKKAQYGNVA